MGRIKMVLERTAPNLNYKNDMRAGRQNEDFFSGFLRMSPFLYDLGSRL